MSELYVKRQKISSQIRRTQIQQYMLSCRAALEKRAVQLEEYQISISLQPYKQEMDKQNYSQQSKLGFLVKINDLDIRKIECCHLLVQMKSVLMHFYDQQYLEQAIRLAKIILAKIIDETNNNGQFLNNCFHQIIELISLQKLQMFQVWQQVALLRNQLYFYSFFKNFKQFLSYQKQISNFVTPIFKTLLNFVIKIPQKNSQVTLKSVDHFNIMQITQQILKKLSLVDKDIKIAALLCKTIFQQNSICTYQILLLPKIVPLFIQAMDQHKQKNNKQYQPNTIEQILNFVGIALACGEQILEQIIEAQPRLFQMLSQKLPVQQTFKTINIIRPVKWAHQNKLITAYSVMGLANLACHSKYKYKIISHQIINKIIQLSAYPHQVAKTEVIFVLWNLLANSEQLEVEILCQKNILWALRNLLQLSDLQALIYCIKCLCIILKAAQRFPSNNMGWKYNSLGVWQEMERNGTIKILEVLVVNSCKQISKYAEKCLNLIGLENDC